MTKHEIRKRLRAKRIQVYEQQVWRWLKLHLAGLPCRGIGLAGLELIEKHMAREEAHA
jgi:hypothetical protein